MEKKTSRKKTELQLEREDNKNINFMVKQFVAELDNCGISSSDFKEKGIKIINFKKEITGWYYQTLHSSLGYDKDTYLGVFLPLISEYAKSDGEEIISIYRYIRKDLEKREIINYLKSLNKDSNVGMYWSYRRNHSLEMPGSEQCEFNIVFESEMKAKYVDICATFIMNLKYPYEYEVGFRKDAISELKKAEWIKEIDIESNEVVGYTRKF